MPVSEKQAQSICTPTEWKTVVNSFPPKVSELGASVAKKNANRVSRFLSKAEAEGDSERAAVMKEALERLQAQTSDSKDQSARRQKEKESYKKRQEQREHRADVREKLQQKAEEEKAEKAGESEDSEDSEPEEGVKEKKAKGVRARLKAASKTADK